MPLYGGFYPESIKAIKEALSFVKSRIEDYKTEKMAMVDKAHHGVIDKEIGKVIGTVKSVEIYLEQELARDIYLMDAEIHEFVMDIIRSALEVYLRDTTKAKAESGLTGFDAKIQDIRRITALEGLKDAETDLYDEYFGAPIPSPEGKKVEVFFSYSHNDRVLAGKIAALLAKREIDVFLAHENIDVSEEWREEIFKHLRSSNFLLALLTPRFGNSVWANQESGYMHGRGGKVIPVIVGRSDVKKFGFLEALQGIHLKEDNLEDCLEQILGIILK